MPTVGHVELSGLESEILGALVKGDGRPNKCIAWDVGLSEECVKAHIYRISRKIRPGGGLGRLGVAIWFLRNSPGPDPDLSAVDVRVESGPA